MGIIDTLSAGFSAVNKRLWVISIPVFLDLFIWLGPKLNAAGLVQEFFDLYADLAARSSFGTGGQNLSPAEQAEATATIAQMGEQMRNIDFFGFLAWQPPSLMYAQLANQPAGLFDMPVLSVHRGITLVGLILGMAFLSLLFQSAYLGGVAHVLRAGDSNLKFMLNRVALNWLRLIGYFALVVLGFVFVGMPVLGVTTLIGMLSPVIASLIGGLLIAVMMWIALYLFFAVSAMFIGDVGPVKGSWYSFIIVRRYFWSAVGLVAIVIMIRFGMSKVWELVLGNPIGVITAILGNSYVDAGLAAASMIYFRDRYAKWQGELEASRILAQKVQS